MSAIIYYDISDVVSDVENVYTEALATVLMSLMSLALFTGYIFYK